MDGFYSIWSKPFLERKATTEFVMADYELLMFLLSVFEWQKNNGKVKLLADAPARDFLSRLDILSWFDDGVEALVVDDDIDPYVFWAAGKLYALKNIGKNSAMIDLDLICWKNMDNEVAGCDIYGIHREDLKPNVYPDFDYFSLKSGKLSDKGYDAEVLPVNTAFLYIKDYEFTINYAEEAINFMKNAAPGNDNLKYMVFAEQRLLPIMANKYDKKIRTMFPLGQDIGYQEYFTHIWGHKNILKYNYEEKMKFCNRISDRIRRDFPEKYEKLSRISLLSNIMKEEI